MFRIMIDFVQMRSYSCDLRFANPGKKATNPAILVSANFFFRLELALVPPELEYFTRWEEDVVPSVPHCQTISMFLSLNMSGLNWAPPLTKWFLVHPEDVQLKGWDAQQSLLKKKKQTIVVIFNHLCQQSVQLSSNKLWMTCWWDLYFCTTLIHIQEFSEEEVIDPYRY